MKLSARNTLLGTVTEVTKGAVNAEVDIRLKGGDSVVSIITIGSLKALGIKKGKKVYALIKASNVMVGVGQGRQRTGRH
jgi:molybdate transport system regulatory protein